MKTVWSSSPVRRQYDGWKAIQDRPEGSEARFWHEIRNAVLRLSRRVLPMAGSSARGRSFIGGQDMHTSVTPVQYTLSATPAHHHLDRVAKAIGSAR